MKEEGKGIRIWSCEEEGHDEGKRKGIRIWEFGKALRRGIFWELERKPSGLGKALRGWCLSAGLLL